MTDFNDMYVRYFEDVYRYVLSICRNEAMAEEITQDTFFKALKSIHSFDGRCKLRVWLCQIARNTYFTRYKERKRYVEGYEIKEEAYSNDMNQKLIDKETAFEIHKLLHYLEEPYKEVFSLRMFGELSFAQIGELFEKTESWARVTYHRAKIKIKEGML